MDAIWEKIRLAAESNDGIISTAQIEQLNISRPMIRKYVDKGDLECARKGIYYLADADFDEYALIQAQSSKAIFSYGTALYLWGLSDRTPHYIDVTFAHGTNTTVLRKNNADLRCHYVGAQIHELGVTITDSPQGGKVKLYDKERCICDLIRHKDQMDMQLFSQALNIYFKSGANVRKLMKYAKALGIENKVRIYTEVMQ